MYDEKTTEYFQTIRNELLDLIPIENRNGNMLEIGAGAGNTLIYAKENGYAKQISGIELCTIKNSFQNNQEFEKFIIGNIENIDLPFDEGQFDVILCGDVLEHLIDPYQAINRLKKLLKHTGVLITSIPNIREWQTMRDIFFRGNFKYTDAGILDKTHLRFFCKKNIVDLFLDNDLEIVKMISNTECIGHGSKIFNRLTLNLFEEFLAAQYYTVAKKSEVFQ